MDLVTHHSKPRGIVSIRTLFSVVFISFLLGSCTSPMANDALQRQVDGQSSSEGVLSASEDEERMQGVISGKQFAKKVLVNNLNEPTEFEILDDGKVLFTQRRGTLMLFDPAEEELLLVAELDVHTKFEDGLMGLALDPDYEQNHWIYLYYSPASTHPDAEKEDYVPTEEESRQHLSRFVYKDGVLDLESEIVMLEVKTQRIECCHTGGSIEFGPDGNLFLSTGDDVNPFASDGFGPMDEQPGRSPWDGQTTSANTNDLRGKILRITPQPDGTYTIPEGNLFSEGTPKTRPEIYVMGNRNPYRISIDQKTGYLYWGEVGPDANENSPERGPRGHDEVNQARQAGNFGWPLFVADNKAYHDYDFATQKSGDPHDSMAPINDSPNNTGLRELPPAQKAFIWYPYAESEEFPVLGSGGRNAMAGPVFYKDAYESGAHSFPAEYDGKLFIYDWIRGWIMTVTMDENSDLVQIDPFMPDEEFSNPIDMQFDKEGVLYVMEYGKGWFSQNVDARISRIEYNSDASMAMEASGKDADVLVNAPPQVDIVLNGNQSFYFENDSREYEVHVSDSEDGSLENGDINVQDIRVQLDYLPVGFDKTLIAQGHQMADEAKGSTMAGKGLIENSDCASCHFLDMGSIGPSYQEVATKYAGDSEAKPYLMDKIKNGGGGVWGEQPMAAHPQFSEEELDAIVEYILSVNDGEEAGGVNLGASGSMSFTEHGGDEASEGTYYIRAAYTDKGGNELEPITSEATVMLRHSRVQAESFETAELENVDDGWVGVYDGTYIGFSDIDLTDISSLTIFARMVKGEAGGRIEARVGSADGELIGQVDIEKAADAEALPGTAFSMPIEAQEGMGDLYFVFRHDNSSDISLFGVDWVQFNN